jgi:hypothetical protein
MLALELARVTELRYIRFGFLNIALFHDRLCSDVALICALLQHMFYAEKPFG